MKISPRTGLAAAATASLLALTGVAAVAQDGGDLPTDESDPTEDGDTTRADRREERATAFSEALAAELGLDADTVADAVTTVREQQRSERQAEMLVRLTERLDERVASGDLTQEQADSILELAEAGVLPGRPGRGGRGHGPRGHGPRGGGFQAPVAEGASA